MSLVSSRSACAQPATRVSGLRRAAAVVALVAATALTGCAYDTLETPAPAAGVNADQKNVKLRSLVIVADDEGTGRLTGAVVSTTDDVLTQILAVADGDDLLPVSPLSVSEVTLQAPANTLVSLTDKKIAVKGDDLTPGLTAKLQLTFEKAGAVVVTVPVLSADNPDFQS